MLAGLHCHHPAHPLHAKTGLMGISDQHQNLLEPAIDNLILSICTVFIDPLDKEIFLCM
jgi:hypothetical protein